MQYYSIILTSYSWLQARPTLFQKLIAIMAAYYCLANWQYLHPKDAKVSSDRQMLFQMIIPISIIVMLALSNNIRTITLQ